MIFGVPVHPRACGERSGTFRIEMRSSGSSPRVRGTAARKTPCWGCWRFIPARAGNGDLPKKPPASATVHPRACGERFRDWGQLIGSTGSSPRVRGTGYRASARAWGIRFIPARAGNGRLASGTGRGSTVHPRACGERQLDVVRELVDCGSSPRVRGTVTHCRSPLLPVRFIPARAGNGHGSAGSGRAVPVHPRACGER